MEIYVKQLATGNTAGINPQKKCILPSVTENLPYLSLYVQEQLNKKAISPSSTTYKYIPEVNDFQRWLMNQKRKW